MFKFAVLSILVACLPNGAPKCSINDKAIEKGMFSPSDSSLAYTVVSEPDGEGKWNIKIGGSRQDFQGYFIRK